MHVILLDHLRKFSSKVVPFCLKIVRVTSGVPLLHLIDNFEEAQIVLE